VSGANEWVQKREDSSDSQLFKFKRADRLTTHQKYSLRAVDAYPDKPNHFAVEVNRATKDSVHLEPSLDGSALQVCWLSFTMQHSGSVHDASEAPHEDWHLDGAFSCRYRVFDVFVSVACCSIGKSRVLKIVSTTTLKRKLWICVCIGTILKQTIATKRV
jgi:hypothetical protein